MRAGPEDHRVLRPAEMDRLAADAVHGRRRTRVNVREVQPTGTVVAAEVGGVVKRVMADKALARARTAQLKSAFVYGNA